MIVVDACVAIKWYAPEDGRPHARAIIANGIRCVAPTHLAVELGRALLRHLRAGTMSRRQVDLALATLPQYVRLVATEPLVPEALDLADRFGVTIYDAVYVAAARDTGCRLVTADRRIVDRLRDTYAGRYVRLLGESLTDEPPAH